MRKILHLFFTATLLLALAGNTKAQTDYTIYSGDGENTYAPAWTGWSYSFAEYIYHYANMPSPGTYYNEINSISSTSQERPPPAPLVLTAATLLFTLRTFPGRSSPMKTCTNPSQATKCISRAMSLPRQKAG